MSTPRVYVVSYDITDDDRRDDVFDRLHHWGEHLQYSVFQCRMVERDRDEMVNALRELICDDEDQILVFDLGPSAGRAESSVISLGQRYEPPRREAIVV